MLFSRKNRQTEYEEIKAELAGVFRSVTGKEPPSWIYCNKKSELEQVKISQPDALRTALKDERVAKILAAWLSNPEKKIKEIEVGLYHSTDKLVPPYKKVWPGRPDTWLYCFCMIGNEELRMTVGCA